MNKKVFEKLIAVLIVSILGFYSLSSGFYAYGAEPQPVKISRTVSTASTAIGDTFTIHYDITGDEIKVPFMPKELVVIIDCSGSMKYSLDGSNTNPPLAQQRLTIAKAGAKEFVKYFEGSDTRVMIVPYSGYAGSNKAISSFYDMQDANSVRNINTYIDSLGAEGGTNTGDAFRMAYNRLATLGESGVKKYIVTLTDGEPTFYTYQKPGNAYYMGSSAVNNNTIVTNTGNDYTKGMEYATNWAAYINGRNTDQSNKLYNSFIIGFADRSATLDQKLETLGASAGADSVGINGNKHYYKALTAADLQAAYKDIKDKISDTLPFSFMHFSDILPEGVVVDPAFMDTLSGMGLSNQVITYNGKNRVQISGPLSTLLKKVREESDGVVYRIDDTHLSFTVQVMATTDGQKLFEKGVTKIEYTYVLPDGTVVTPPPATNQNEQTVTINLRTATLSLPGITVLKGGTEGILTAAVNPSPPNYAEFTTASSLISLTDKRNNTAGVTGNDVGTARVNAVTSSENGYYAPVSADCDVKVAEVTLRDMYVLAGCEIPLNLESAGDTSDIHISNYFVTGNNGNVAFTNGGLSNSKVKGLLATETEGVTLKVTFSTSSGSQKELTCKVYVVDFETDTNLEVKLWEKGYINYSKKVPESAPVDKNTLLGKIDFTTAEIHNDGNIIADYRNPDKWEIKGVKLTTTPVLIRVTKTFDCSSFSQLGPTTQTAQVEIPIRVSETQADIN